MFIMSLFEQKCSLEDKTESARKSPPIKNKEKHKHKTYIIK